MIQEGQKLPSSTFKIMTPEGLQETTSDQLFSGKKIVLFAVPGAFTPTCSIKHLPGYVDHAAALKSKGIDAIFCVAVNDAFVLDAWAKSCQADLAITMLSDGNGDFTKALGLEMDAGGYGMGIRSQRYAMIVEDGIVSNLKVEAPVQFEVSSAEHILSLLS